jgi:hypothetical protein
VAAVHANGTMLNGFPYTLSDDNNTATFSPTPVAGDVDGDGDGNVATADLLALLAQWGGPGSCDFDGGGVATSDLLKLLSMWGPCP